MICCSYPKSMNWNAAAGELGPTALGHMTACTGVPSHAMLGKPQGFIWITLANKHHSFCTDTGSWWRTWRQTPTRCLLSAPPTLTVPTPSPCPGNRLFTPSTLSSVGAASSTTASCTVSLLSVLWFEVVAAGVLEGDVLCTVYCDLCRSPCTMCHDLCEHPCTAYGDLCLQPCTVCYGLCVYPYSVLQFMGILVQGTVMYICSLV